MFPYAIVRTPAVVDDGEGAILGVGGEPVRVIRDGDLAVVVGEAPTAAGPERFLDVVSRLADAQPAVPMRAVSEPLTRATLASLLKSGSARFDALLTRLRDRAEWSIVFARGPGAAEVENGGPESVFGGGGGGGGGIGHLIRARRARWRRLGVPEPLTPTLERAVRELAAFVDETRLSVRPGAIAIAALVERDREDTLRDWYRDAGPRFDAPSSLVGPFPAFSFVTTELDAAG